MKKKLTALLGLFLAFSVCSLPVLAEELSDGTDVENISENVEEKTDTLETEETVVEGAEEAETKEQTSEEIVVVPAENAEVAVASTGPDSGTEVITVWGAYLSKDTYVVGDDAVHDVNQQVVNENFTFEINGEKRDLVKNVDYEIEGWRIGEKQGSSVAYGEITHELGTINSTPGTYCVSLKGIGTYAGLDFALRFDVIEANSIGNYTVTTQNTYQVGRSSKFISDLEEGNISWNKTSDNSEVSLQYGTDYVIGSYYDTVEEAGGVWRIINKEITAEEAFRKVGHIIVNLNGTGKYSGTSSLAIDIKPISEVDNSSTKTEVNIDSTSTESVNKIIDAALKENGIENPETQKLVISVEDATPAPEEITKIAQTLPEGFEPFYLYVNLKVETDTKIFYITDAADPVKITISIPAGIQKPDRKFKVVRVHNGEAEVIGTYIPESGETLKEVTIESDKFSTYALAYADAVSYSFTEDVKLYDKSAQSGLTEGKYKYTVGYYNQYSAVTETTADIIPTISVTNGVLKSSPITYTKAGKYCYIVQPEIDRKDTEYVPYSSDSVMIVVTVTESNGKLQATSSIGEIKYDESTGVSMVPTNRKEYSFYVSDLSAALRLKAILQMNGGIYENGKYQLVQYAKDENDDWKEILQYTFDEKGIYEENWGENALHYELKNPGDSAKATMRYQVRYIGDDKDIVVEDKAYDIEYTYYLDENGKFHAEAPGLDNMVFNVTSKNANKKPGKPSSSSYGKIIGTHYGDVAKDTSSNSPSTSSSSAGKTKSYTPVNTADDSNAAVWLSIMGLAIVSGIFAVLIRKRRA